MSHKGNIVILKQSSGRAVKDQVYNLLRSDKTDQALEELQKLPYRKVINPIFSLLYHGNPLVKWNAVRAMGVIVNHIAREDMESARIIIRRLMWSLNDESGGIGWGSCEAMGEILARNPELAEEYSMMLMSYARKDGNYQEHELMQRGVLWGIGRLALENPGLVRDIAASIACFFCSPDPAVRGHASWVAGLLNDPQLIGGLKRLTYDYTEIEIYIGYELITRKISDLAGEAIANLTLRD
jgi:hypothetical protein